MVSLFGVVGEGDNLKKNANSANNRLKTYKRYRISFGL